MFRKNLRKTASLWLLGLIAVHQLSAQEEYGENLVMNFSFEELNACPSDYGAIDEAVGWMGLNFTPDLFHVCSEAPKVGVPQNYFGNQWAADGKGYIGLLIYHERSPLEFVGTRFREPMQKGKKYMISFKICWAKVYSNYASDNIGILLTNDLMGATSVHGADVVVDEIITESDRWETVSKTIIVDEDYQFLAIGNFVGKEKTKKYQVQQAGYPGAYYYVDDIRVQRVLDEDDPERFIKVVGRVFDEDTRQPIPARIDFVLPEKNFRAFEEADTTRGYYEFSNMQKTQYFYLEVKSEGYFSKRIFIERNPDDSYVVQDFHLKPSLPGNSVILDDIYFDTGQTKPNDKSRDALKLLANFLQEHPDLKVEISGHTDNTGNAHRNQVLSEQRAEAIVVYLIDEGFISPRRLTFVGYGDTQPISDNETSEGKEKNRRVELKILEE